jgi:hypothetical protein
MKVRLFGGKNNGLVVEVPEDSVSIHAPIIPNISKELLDRGVKYGAFKCYKIHRIVHITKNGKKRIYCFGVPNSYNVDRALLTLVLKH